MPTGKYERTEEWKKRVYSQERNKRIADALKGNKNCLGKQNAKKEGFWYSKGYKRIGRKGLFEHRVIWEHANGIIPTGYEIHHLNGIRDDNRVENLQLLSKSEHAKLTWVTRR